MPQRQLTGFWDSVGNAIGEWGLSAQGAEDQAMYADPGGAPYATTAGVDNYETAVVEAATSWKRTALLVAGAGIILVTLVTSD